jgi:hypothetical protein
MLMTMMQQMMAEMACSNAQVHAQLASTNDRISELELHNQELHNTIPATHDSQLHTGHSLSLEHSLQFTSHTPKPRSPHFKTETFPEDLVPRGNLDDTP